MDTSAKLIFLIFILCTTLVKSQAKENTNDSLDNEKNVWVSGEYGCRSKDFNDKYIESGVYKKISLELPFGSRISLLILFDGQDETLQGGALGISFTVLRDRGFEMLCSPSVFTAQGNSGLLFPVTFGFRIFHDTFRLQSTISYRIGGQFSPAGHSSASFFTASAGIGIELNNLLPKNPKR